MVGEIQIMTIDEDQVSTDVEQAHNGDIADMRLIRRPENVTSREVPLSTKAVDILRDQRSRQDTPTPFPINANAFRLAWERLRKRAELCDLRFHDLRHEAISRFFEMGLSVPEVALISGHRDLRMLASYIHLNSRSVVKKIETLL